MVVYYIAILMKKKKVNKYQRLIRKFLKEPDAVWKNVGLIKREMSIAKKLYKKNNSEKFWREAHLPFKLNSLAWLLSKEGLDFIDLELKRQKTKLPKTKIYNINECKKFGRNRKIKNKPLTLMEFLKDAEKKD